MTVNQIDLIAAICKYLKRAGCKTANARQYSAIIAAANTVMDAIEEPHKPATDGMGLDAWLLSDETGISSEFMAGVLSGRFMRKPGYPRDPSDFARCLGLLRAAPELRANLDRLKDHGKEWAALVGRWSDLERLYAEEAPSGQAPKLYALMQELT